MALILPKLSYDQSRPEFFATTLPKIKKMGWLRTQSRVQRRVLMNAVFHSYEYRHGPDNMTSTAEVKFNNSLNFSTKYLCFTWLNASVWQHSQHVFINCRYEIHKNWNCEQEEWAAHTKLALNVKCHCREETICAVVVMDYKEDNAESDGLWQRCILLRITDYVDVVVLNN
jgi:hypothetical protein